jgi:hypothetical protein
MAGEGAFHSVRHCFSQAELAQAVAAFRLPGAFQAAAPYGNGHINDTFVVHSTRPDGAPARHILQRINHQVFPDIPLLMANIARVTAHLRARFAAWPGHDPDRETLTLVPARDGAVWHRDGAGNAWRMYLFIEGARTIEDVQHPRQAREAARAFARFQRLLADLPPPRLGETIPGFHDTPRRLAAFERSLARDLHNRAAGAAPEIAFVRARAAQAHVIVDALARGALPERITHNDTKINNVMLRDGDDAGQAVIDLDTVMPGSVLYDFGDQVRTTTCTGAEDEADPSRVRFCPDRFAALAAGCLEEAGAFLVPAELDLLAFSGRLITLEIGIRFLADYLDGDIYFRTHGPEHNLVRARTQFGRVCALEAAAEQMEAIVARCREAAGATAPAPAKAGESS